MRQTPAATAREKLVYVIHDLDIGGVEVALLSAIPALCARYDLRVVALGYINPALLSGLSPAEQKVFTVFDCPTSRMPFQAHKIVAHIRALNPDILVCSLWRSSWIGAKVKARVPGIRLYAFIHSTRYFHRLDRFYSRLAMRRADVVLVDAQSTRAFVERQLKGKEKPIGVVSFMTHPSPPANPHIGRARQFKDRTVRFLFIGSLSKVKNIPDAIRLVAALKERGHDVCFDLYGRPRDSYEETLALIKKLELESVVRYRGPLDPAERFSVFTRYDVYLQLSYFEGMAMSVAEAMQYGMVCVVTPVGEIPHYAKDGVSAIFVHGQMASPGEETLSRIQRVISDTAQYDWISAHAFQYFQGKPCYADSLIAHLSENKVLDEDILGR
jgi:glycosyltransferase involved in cell wall biosynthesis